MDQYVSWGLPTDQLTLDTIWGRFEEFWKFQSNKVCARFDLLTSFRQGSRSVDEWYNAVQAQVILEIFLRNEEFVSRTISDGTVDIEKFPASRVRQLAKNLESSKAAACHIKQVAGDAEAGQINLLRHQHTELPAGKYKNKRSPVKSKQAHHKPQNSENYH